MRRAVTLTSCEHIPVISCPAPGRHLIHISFTPSFLLIWWDQTQLRLGRTVESTGSARCISVFSFSLPAKLGSERSWLVMLLLYSLKETINMEDLASNHNCPDNCPFHYWRNPTWSKKSHAFSVDVIWALMPHRLKENVFCFCCLGSKGKEGCH